MIAAVFEKGPKNARQVAEQDHLHDRPTSANSWGLASLVCCLTLMGSLEMDCPA
jgi:hypothetical protein